MLRTCQGVKLSFSINNNLYCPTVAPQALRCHAECGNVVAEAVITGLPPWDFLEICWADTAMLQPVDKGLPSLQAQVH